LGPEIKVYKNINFICCFVQMRNLVSQNQGNTLEYMCDQINEDYKGGGYKSFGKRRC